MFDPGIGSMICLLLTFVVQLLLCFFIKNRFLKHISLAIPVIAFIYAVQVLLSDPGFFLGFNILAGVIYAGVGVAGLSGYALAWCIYHIVRKSRK